VMHSRATDRKECVQMPGKMARSDPRPSARVTRGAGSGQHLASVLQEGRENANIDAGLGFIWRIWVNSARRVAFFRRSLGLREHKLASQHIEVVVEVERTIESANRLIGQIRTKGGS